MSTAFIAASVAIVVAFLTPAVTSFRARRDAVNEKFDRAIAALLLVQAARHTPNGLSDSHVAKLRPGVDVKALTQRLTEQGLDFYIETTAAAKTALVAIEQYVPEVRSQVTTDWEIAEEAEPALRQAIESRRAAAVKTERLFRPRTPPSK